MYHGEGECEWDHTIVGSKLGNFVTDKQLLLENNVTNDRQAICDMNGTELLNIIIVTTGKVVDYY